MRYFDPDGNPLTAQEWSELFEARFDDTALESWWRRRTDLGNGVEVSTVWLGLDHSFGGGPPKTWETMIFGGEHDQQQWRYSSRAEAFDAHERIIRALRGGAAPSFYEHSEQH